MKLNNVYALLIMICCMAIPNVTHAQEQTPEVSTETENQDPPPEEDKYNKDESDGGGGGGGYSSGTIFQLACIESICRPLKIIEEFL